VFGIRSLPWPLRTELRRWGADVARSHPNQAFLFDLDRDQPLEIWVVIADGAPVGSTGDTPPPARGKNEKARMMRFADRAATATI